MKEEKGVFDDCIKILQKQNIKLILDEENVRPFSTVVSRMTFDAIGRIEFKIFNTTFFFEIRNTINPSNANKLLSINQDLKHPLCIISEYISYTTKESFKQAGISYVCVNDETMYIDGQQFLVYIEQSARKKDNRVKDSNKLTKAQALLFVHLLRQPDLVEMKNAEIATITGLSTGSVSNVINSFVALGLVNKKGRARKLNDLPDEFKGLHNDLKKDNTILDSIKNVPAMYLENIDKCWLNYIKQKSN